MSSSSSGAVRSSPEPGTPWQHQIGGYRWLAGLPVFESGPVLDEATAHRPLILATGLPGDAHICRPFLVHAAQRHRGTRPWFMSRTPMFLSTLSPYGSTPLGRLAWRNG
ncbi:hypothetical protein [Microtetraspora glauca]|uniref:Uncharacterized protein n=1 Tax=Microtetraspora glauca TaxID=1996 RepID=A0ABV3GKL3_MICGL